MSSGGKQEVINSLERALSIDINRLQLFAAMDRAEIARFQANVGAGTDDLDAEGAPLTQVTTLTSPLTAEIVNGFCVRPDVGDLNVAVDPGVLWCIAPDADVDSSNYKLVRDPGVTNAGSLAMSANASGLIRIDVIECSYVLNTVETDNRDIFNPATNTFTASSVTKATQAGLLYRVRQGTAGGGFPGTSVGWLPLAVASVPTGTTTCDTITFWDVRPLLGDRVLGPQPSTVDLPQWKRALYTVDTLLSATHSIMRGVVEATPADLVAPAPGQRRLGGRLRRGTPGADGIGALDGVDLNDSANWASGVAFGGGIAYIYLLEPFGLPRWARYTDASTGLRKPRAPRGMLVVAGSTTPPAHAYGSPSVVVPLPTSTGLSGSTAKGICIGSAGFSSGAANPTTADGRTQWCPIVGPSAIFSNAAGTVATVVATTAYTATFTLTEGTTHPAGARALHLDWSVAVTISAAVLGNLRISFTVFDTTAVEDFVDISGGSWPINNSGGAATYGMSGTIRIPFPTNYPTVTALTRKVVMTISSSGGLTQSASPTLPVLTTVGWDLY